MESSRWQTGTAANALDAWQARKVTGALVSSPSSAQAASALVARRDSPDATAFERYAGRVLADARALELAGSPLAGSLMLTPSDGSEHVRLLAAGETPSGMRELLAAAEGALNRLIDIANALDSLAGRPAADPQARSVGISWAGVSYLPQVAEDAALDRISGIDAGLPGQSYLNELDWRIIDNVASTAHHVFQMSLLPNMRQAIAGVSAPDGGDWDVRSRLATNLERLDLSLGSEFRFDCDVVRKAIWLSFTVPGESAFPARALDRETGKPADARARIGSARSAYAVRLACLLAAACFGAGKRIERAFLTGTAGDGSALISCSFSRGPFVRDTLVAIDAGTLADPELRFDPLGTAQVARPESLKLAGFTIGGHAQAQCPSVRAGANRIEARLDERPLPDSLQELFRARRICDIDTALDDDDAAAEVALARSDAEQSPLAAIVRLERIAGELESALAPPGDDADARPLYCANPLARLAVALAADELDVGAQAQAFLDGTPQASAKPRVRYFRAPGALFNARLGLSDLYGRMGDERGAEAQADKCIELAPTSAQAHFRRADALAQSGRFEEAANVLVEGLKRSIAESDCALLYYHLALVLWNLGLKRESAAVHVYASSLAGEHAVKSRAAVGHLRKHPDAPVIAFASPQAAARDMAATSIPVAPSAQARTLIVKAALGLANANAPRAAAPYAAAMARLFPHDSVIQAAVRSICYGTAEQAKER